ncbi:MAG: hypothetical protein QW478_15485 [Candidatus Micrarchaeaceae archaeon]
MTKPKQKTYLIILSWLELVLTANLIIFSWSILSMQLSPISALIFFLFFILNAIAFVFAAGLNILIMR